MSMIEVKTAELIGSALDWAVAKVESVPIVFSKAAGFWRIADIPDIEEWLPSSSWEQGGPLIEKHQIDLCWDGVDGKAMWWNAYHQDIAKQQTHQSPLIAAMRAIVAAKLGDAVSVPAELVQQQGEGEKP